MQHAFDVVSLFTKIPIDLAIDVARHRLEEYMTHSLSERTSLTIDSITTLLIFCLKATYIVPEVLGLLLSANLWNSNGFPRICHGSQPADGGC